MKRVRFAKIMSLLLAGMMFSACTPVNPDEMTDVSSEEPEPVINAEEHLVAAEGGYLIYSPDKTVVMTLGAGDSLFYSVSRAEADGVKEWIKPSFLGVTVGSTAYGSGATVKSSTVEYIKEDRALMGNQDKVKVRCIESIFTLEKDGAEFKLEVRAYNDGVAFRYILPAAGNTTKLSEQTSYNLRSDVTECWYSVYTGELGSRDYETAPKAHDPGEKQTKPVYAPMTAIIGDNQGYISIMEGDINTTYPGTTLSADGNGSFGTSFMANPVFPKDVEMITPWRLINIADDLNGIVNNYNIYSLSDLPDETVYADTSWIQGGRSTWSWVCEGFLKDNPYRPGEVMWAGAPTEDLMMQYIDIAAKLGFEYNIIDDGWPSWENYKSELKTLGKLGESNNVRQILWGGITLGSDGYNKMPTEEKVDEFFKLLKDTHIYGGKIDFWWSEARSATTALQRYILEEAARENLVINFHGCNKNTGLNARYPNELTREGVRGIEQFGMSEWANNAEYARWLNAQLYTRYLCGHADWTPATYSAMQIASLICIDSPLMVVSTHPDDILSSPAVEFIKSIPTTWDQTVVLSDSKIGRYSAYAKEKDGVWFVGGISSSLRRGVKVDLSEFLPNDGTYTAEIWTGNTGELKKQVITVSSRDEIELGGVGTGYGYAIRLTKLELSQYGGEIKGDITVKAPAFATVKYTTDGTDPLVSDTAVKCKNNTISLDKSCRLTVAIVSGSGKGTKISYQFNKIREQ